MIRNRSSSPTVFGHGLVKSFLATRVLWRLMYSLSHRLGGIDDFLVSITVISSMTG